MIRNLLATTAIATLLATGAMAQTSTTTTAPAATDTAPADATAPVTPAEGQLASNLIGENVYNGTAEDAETIGDVNDLVLTDEGQIESIVIGVGGFLGIGEKNVAVAYNEIDWAERDGDRWIVIETSADALRELPAFDRRAYEPVPAAGGDMAAGTTTTGGSTTAMAPASGTAATTGTETTAPMTGDTAANNPAASGTTSTDTAMAPTSADTTTTAAVDRSTLTEVPAGEMSAENLEGTTVYGMNDENVGDIGDVVLTSDGQVDAIIIDVGGFLGIGEKQVALGMDNLAFMQDGSGNRYLYTQFTKEQLEAQPAYEEANWAAQRDQMRMTAPN